MYALASYFVAAKLWLRFLPGWALVGATSIVAMASFLGYVPARGNTGAIVENCLYFVLGIVAARAVSAFASRPRPLIAGLSATAFLIAVVVLRGLDLGLLEPLLQVPLRVLALVAGVAVAVVIAGSLPRFAQRFAVIGRQTLPIYVMHGLILIVVRRLSTWTLARWTTGSEGVAAVYPLLVGSLLVVMCLGLHRLLLAVGGSWLFSLPALDRNRAGVPLPRSPLKVPLERSADPLS